MLPSTAVASLAKRTTGFITAWLRRKKPPRPSNRASVRKPPAARKKTPAARKATPRETLQALGIFVELTEREASAEEIELYGESARSADIGVYICYDRHFPEGARALGLNGAEIVFNPSATVAGLSEYLWKLEQPAHAVANGYFVGAINRVGREQPWNIGEFYGQSYFCTPRGKLIAEGSRDKEEVIVADLNLDEIEEVRQVWQFFRDRRPESYGDLVKE